MNHPAAIRSSPGGGESHIENILFDLDGTLTDPEPGITRCIQYALHELGRAVPCGRDLTWCIGPPLRESFVKLLADASADEADRALSLYRRRFSTIGKFENHLYDEVPAMLAALRRMGLRLFVATAKPQLFAREIVVRFGIADLFAEIWGSELSGKRVNKAELIGHVMEQENLAPEHTLMVGDRRHDMEGARQRGLQGIGVLYGYGSREELTAAGAAWLAHTPTDVLRIVCRTRE